MQISPITLLCILFAVFHIKNVLL